MLFFKVVQLTLIINIQKIVLLLTSFIFDRREKSVFFLSEIGMKGYRKVFSCTTIKRLFIFYIRNHDNLRLKPGLQYSFVSMWSGKEY